MINLLLCQDDLSASFWLFPFVLWEIIYSGQVCAGTTTSILSKATKSFPSKPENLSFENWEILCGQNCKSCGRKSWQILHSALCSAPSAAVIGFFKLKSQITRSIIPNYLRDAKKCKWNIKCLKYSSPKHLTVFIL